jgi:hypothetical protein
VQSKFTVVFGALFVVLTTTTPMMAQSGRISGAFVGCLTEDVLDEFIQAATNNDRRQMQALLNVSCFNLDGREYSVMERGFLTSRIRVYAGDGSVPLYTVSEALR